MGQHGLAEDLQTMYGVNLVEIGEEGLDEWANKLYCVITPREMACLVHALAVENIKLAKVSETSRRQNRISA